MSMIMMVVLMTMRVILLKCDYDNNDCGDHGEATGSGDDENDVVMEVIILCPMHQAQITGQETEIQQILHQRYYQTS